MTAQEQYDLLEIRLEDAGNVDVTPAMKMHALHFAQITLANKLAPELLTELEVIKTGLALSSGVKALTKTNIDYDLLRGGDGVRKVIVTGGKEATRIDQRDVKTMESSLLAATADNPVFTVFQGNLMVYPTTITSVELWFLRVPPPLRHAFTYTANGEDAVTKIDASAAQNLVATNDYYNNCVIKLSEASGGNQIVTDFVASGLVFTVSPGSSSTFVSGTFEFLTHDFDLTNLSAVTSLINPGYHDIMLTLAEAECFGMLGEDERRENAWLKAMDEIASVNARYIPAKGAGTREK